MPFIIAKEDAGLSPTTDSADADSYVKSGSAIGVDWIEILEEDRLAKLRLAGPYTFPGGAKALPPGEERYCNPARFLIPTDALRPVLTATRVSEPAPQRRELLISAEECNEILGSNISASQLEDLNDCLERFEINTPLRISHFLAQVGHETGGLRWMKELADGQQYEYRRDLGNIEPGDGPRFKGAGALQLTGRYNYQVFADYIGDPDVMQGCEYVASRYPFTSAGHWWHVNSMNTKVHNGATCRRISYFVNGRDPANGLAERERLFEKARRVLLGSSVDPSSRLVTESERCLHVPYFSQRDSATTHAHRMCFSSSCAMLLAALKPGDLQGRNADDEYLKRVFETGMDTTQAEAQLQALRSYGVAARFVQDADFRTIEEQIDKGIPVPCGYLHRGPVDQPSGGGHWLCVIGYTPDAVIVHDPYGDCDLIRGGHVAVSGERLLYSRKNFGKRWMLDRSNRYVPGHGWAILASR